MVVSQIVDRNFGGNRFGVFVAVLYGTLSIMTTLLNKIVINRFFFDYPTVIMMLQMGSVLLIIEFARLFGILKLQPYTFDRAKDMLLPSLLYCLHSYFSLTALEGMSLPMYGAIKRCVPIVNLYLAVMILKKPKPSRNILLSVALITFGAALASMYDFLMDGWSYLYGLLSVGFQALYLTLIERLSLTNQFSPLEMLYVNSFNGMVFFMVVDMVQDEIRDSVMYVLTSASTLFYLSLVALLVCGALLNFSLFLCTVHNSALTTSIVGSVKAIVTTLLGYFIGFYLFFDIVPQFWNFVGVFLNVAGCIIYSMTKMKEMKSVETHRVVDLHANKI